MRIFLYIVGTATLLLAFGSATQGAEDRDLFRTSLGVQAALASPGVDEHVNRGDVFITWPTRFRQAWASGWGVSLDGIANVGVLSDGEQEGVLGGVGVRLGSAHRSGFVASGGFRPTLISEDHLGNRNLGGSIQFGSQVRLGWRFCGAFEAGVALEHLSNGGITSPNPGLNQVLLDVGIRF